MWWKEKVHPIASSQLSVDIKISVAIWLVAVREKPDLSQAETVLEVIEYAEHGQAVHCLDKELTKLRTKTRLGRGSTYTGITHSLTNIDKTLSYSISNMNDLWPL